jgi:hypothetical protein
VYPEEFFRLSPDTYLLVFSDHDALAEIKQSEFAVGCEQFLSLIKGKIYTPRT